MIVYFHLYLYLTVMVYLGLGHLCGVNCSKSTLTHEQNSQLEKLKRSSNSDGSDRGQLKPGEKKGRAHFRWLLPIMSLRSHLFPSNREKFHLSLGKSFFLANHNFKHLKGAKLPLSHNLQLTFNSWWMSWSWSLYRGCLNSLFVSKF